MKERQLRNRNNRPEYAKRDSDDKNDSIVETSDDELERDIHHINLNELERERELTHTESIASDKEFDYYTLNENPEIHDEFEPEELPRNTDDVDISSDASNLNKGESDHAENSMTEITSEPIITEPDDSELDRDETCDSF